jgi:hypothetical protein
MCDEEGVDAEADADDTESVTVWAAAAVKRAAKERAAETSILGRDQGRDQPGERHIRTYLKDRHRTYIDSRTGMDVEIP